jgi:hypothetical protein
MTIQFRDQPARNFCPLTRVIPYMYCHSRLAVYFACALDFGAGHPATVLPVHTPGGVQLNRPQRYGLGLKERPIMDSPFFRQLNKPVASRQQLPDPNQPK